MRRLVLGLLVVVVETENARSTYGFPTGSKCIVHYIMSSKVFQFLRRAVKPWNQNQMKERVSNNLNIVVHAFDSITQRAQSTVQLRNNGWELGEQGQEVRLLALGLVVTTYYNMVEMENARSM